MVTINDVRNFLAKFIKNPIVLAGAILAVLRIIKNFEKKESLMETESCDDSEFRDKLETLRKSCTGAKDRFKEETESARAIGATENPDYMSDIASYERCDK